MEFDPGALLSPERNTDDDKKEKEKRKKGFNLKVPIPYRSAESDEKSEKPKVEMSMFDRALADLAMKQKSENVTEKANVVEKIQNEKKTETDPHQKEKLTRALSNAETEVNHARLAAIDTSAEGDEDPQPTAETDTDTDDQQTEEQTEQPEPQANLEEDDSAGVVFKNTERLANDLSAGEGYIRLQGDSSLQERTIMLEGAVIPLRSPETSDTTHESVNLDEQLVQSEPPPEFTSDQSSQSEQIFQEVEAAPTETAAHSGGDVPPVEPPPRAERSFEEPEEPEEPEHVQSAETEFTPFTPKSTTEANASQYQAPEMSTPAPNAFMQPDMTSDGPVVGVMPSPEAYYGIPASHPKNNEQFVTKDQLEDEVHNAKRDASRRGVLAGLIVGGAYEHFKHRRREKKLQKNLKLQTKNWDKANAVQQSQIKEQSQQLQKAQQQNKQEIALPIPVVPNEERRNTVAVTRPETVMTQRVPELIPVPVALVGEQRFTTNVAVSERPAISTNESTVASVGPERHAAKPERSFKATIEKLLPKRAQKNQRSQNPEVVDQLEIPADHHLETSSWHTIEIDSKTGKPVENPTFQYGNEYYKERAHESGPQDDDRNAAAGEVALVAAAMAQAVNPAIQQGRLQTSQPSNPLPPNIAQSTAAQPVMSKAKKNVLDSNGPIWPWIVAFVVVVVLIVAVAS